MNEENRQDNDRIVSSRGLRLWHFVLIALLAVTLIVLVFVSLEKRRQPGEKPGKEGITEVPEGSRAVTLFFADGEKEGLVGETRQVAIGREFSEQVKQTIEALLDGPEYSGVSAIPNGTKILDVFYDPEYSVLYLDFSSELVARHPGGSSAEYYTIASIMRTVSENFPEVKAVQFLVEGLQMDTIGGHINANKAFLVKEWR